MKMICSFLISITSINAMAVQNIPAAENAIRVVHSEAQSGGKLSTGKKIGLVLVGIGAATATLSLLSIFVPTLWGHSPDVGFIALTVGLPASALVVLAGGLVYIFAATSANSATLGEYYQTPAGFNEFLKMPLEQKLITVDAYPEMVPFISEVARKLIEDVP